MERLVLRNVKAYYRLLMLNREVEVKAVDGVSLTLRRGDILGLVGESGCGKSTLAKVIMMNINPPLFFKEGSVTLLTRDGKTLELSKLSKKTLKSMVWGKYVSIIPQEAMSALMPTLKIKKIAYDVLRSHDTNITIEEAASVLAKRLEVLGLPSYVVDRYPFELSGGMAQRTVIAISTLLNPMLLIVDEPTSALDVSTQKLIIKTLWDLVSREIIDSMVFITHDISVVRQIANRIAVMYAGKLVEEASTEDIITNPLHPYTQGLIESILSLEPEVRKRGIKYIPGQPPNLINPPSGCRFADRCPFVMNVCRSKEPPFIEVNRNRFVACWLYARE